MKVVWPSVILWQSIRRSVLLHRLKTEIDRSDGVQERRIQDFGGGTPREGDHFEDRGVDKRIILKWILKK